MAFETPAHEWPTAWRYGTAALNGVAWTMLWYGFDALGVHVLVILGITVLLVAPVLAFVARGGVDFAIGLAMAVAASFVVAYLLVPWTPRETGAVALDVLRTWTLVLFVATGVYVLRRRLLKA